MRPRVTQNLKAQPEYAEAIGHLVAASSHLEFICLRLFAGMLGDHGLASRTIYYNTANFRGKINLVQRTASATLDPEQAANVTRLLDKAYKTYKKRNKFVHGVWADIDDGKTRAVALTEYDPENTKAPDGKSFSMTGVKLSEIKMVARQLHTWSEEIHKCRIALFGTPRF